MRDVIKQDKLFYTQVVNEIIEDKTISLKAIGLFAFMAHKAQIPGVNWNFTIRSMAKQMKDGEDSIRSGLQELRKVGWVVYTKNTDGTGEYFLKASIKPKQDKPDKVLDNQNRENPRRENPKKGNPTPINKNDSLAENNALAKKDVGFDNFWEVFPKKRNIKGARAKWNLKKLDLIADAIIADVLLRITDDRRWVEGFIPDPLTYINQERWNDEVEKLVVQAPTKGTFDSKSNIEKQVLAIKLKQQRSLEC